MSLYALTGTSRRDFHLDNVSSARIVGDLSSPVRGGWPQMDGGHRICPLEQIFEYAGAEAGLGARLGAHDAAQRH